MCSAHVYKVKSYNVKRVASPRKPSGANQVLPSIVRERISHPLPGLNLC